MLLLGFTANGASNGEEVDAMRRGHQLIRSFLASATTYRGLKECRFTLTIDGLLTVAIMIHGISASASASALDVVL